MNASNQLVNTLIRVASHANVVYGACIDSAGKMRLQQLQTGPLVDIKENLFARQYVDEIFVSLYHHGKHWPYLSRHINAAAILLRNAEQLHWAVHRVLQAMYQVRVRRLVFESSTAILRRRIIAVIITRGGPTLY